VKSFKPAQIRYRAFDEPQPGFAREDLLVMDAGHPSHGEGAPRRWFWLRDCEVQLLYEPWHWKNRWYVDLVSIKHLQGSDIYEIRDMEIDIILEAQAPLYRIIDLEKFGERVGCGEFTLEEAMDVLIRTQTFLDRYLHPIGQEELFKLRPGDVVWPPKIVEELFSSDHNYPAIPVEGRGVERS
jgi:hypothetical protein